MAVEYSNLSNAEIRLIAGGDETAFRRMHDLYAADMFRNALRFTKNEEQAKDLTQEIFFRIWTAREKLPSVENFEAYLYVVARNCIFNELKKQLPLNATNDFLETYLQYDWGTPHRKLEFKEVETRLSRAIHALPPQMRTVFRLSRVEGLTHEQIAARMNISSATSKSYIVRALTAIRRQLGEEGEEWLWVLLLFWPLR